MQKSKMAILVAISIITLMMLSNMAFAITGNYEPDFTPNVCVVVLFNDAGQPLSVSSGILISPSVVLTAGHSTVGGTIASVCFDQSPTSSSPIYTGVPITYPEYSLAVESGRVNGDHLFSFSDVGLILLDKPVEGITSASLPTAGLADTLSVKSDLQVIGYGVQFQDIPKNNSPINSWIGTLTRNTAQVQLLSNNFDGSDKYLKCTANQAQGKGGIAFGDSGGPVIYNLNGQNMVLAINAYVNSANCNGISYHTRIDDPQVLNWIADSSKIKQ